jgi:3-dehydroquinate dehydratase / shikimate dehydrogenase
MICVPIASTTEKAALSDLANAEAAADLIELRLDLLPKEAWRLLVKAAKKPLLLTLRAERQGGAFRGGEEERIGLIEEMLSFNPAWVDLDWDTPPALIERIKRRRAGGTRLILSHHDFERTPADLDGLWKRIDSLGSDAVKIVPTATTGGDNARILKLCRSHPGRAVAFCMGPVGLPSRILTLREGGLITFGTLEDGRGTARGQIPAATMRDLYRVKTLGRGTKVFGIVGNPLAHSLSHLIHNTAFSHIGIDAVYIPFVTPDLDGLLPAMDSLGVEGFSVTIPYKEAIIPHLDLVDEMANGMGAVNTVWRNEGRWLGGNTDGDAAWKAMEAAWGDLRGRRWAVLGAGGAAKAVAGRVARLGNPGSIAFFGRHAGRLEETARQMKRIFSVPIESSLLSGEDLGARIGKADVIVNCTPSGMFPETGKSPLSADLLRPSHLVFDAVYNPPETALLRAARQRGCRTVSGLEMFLLQGAAQFELWTGERAPLGLMREKIMERLGPFGT